MNNKQLIAFIVIIVLVFGLIVLLEENAAELAKSMEPEEAIAQMRRGFNQTQLIAIPMIVGLTFFAFNIAMKIANNSRKEK